MSTATPLPGAAPVGLLTDLVPIERAAVIYLRLWNGSPKERKAITSDFKEAFGRDQAGAATENFSALCELCQRHGRRALMRYPVTSGRICADESCFATLLRTTLEGDREDAMLLACLMVRVDMAPVLCALAQEAALTLLQMELRDTPRRTAPTHILHCPKSTARVH